jgi:hypothetical protein
MKRNTKAFSLNGTGTSLTNHFGQVVFGGDQLDKRNDVNGGIIPTINSTINTVASVSDGISNALGNRNPYYIIGEIPEEDDFGTVAEKYGGEIGGMVRAVSKLYYGTKQEGVIIDCLGDVDGESSIDFTQNPVMYVTNNVTDSRLRRGATVTATVCVSNYLSDSIIESVMGSTLSAIDVTGGLMSNAANNALFYGGNTRAQYALYRLRWLMENGNPFTVYTPHGIYENMLIKSIKPKTDDKNMDMLQAEIEFQEVIMYKTYRQTANDDNIPRRPARSAVLEGKSVTKWFSGR